MTTKERFWKKVRKTKTCWLWTGSQRRRGTYKRGNFWFPKYQRKVTAHRVAWEFRHGEIPDGLCVLHKCDVPLCVRPSHLFLGTLADNIHDMDRKGRRGTTRGYEGLKGSSNPHAKLHEATVVLIRALYAQKTLSQAKLAAQFGVTQTLVSQIVRNVIWQHV